MSDRDSGPAGGPAKRRARPGTRLAGAPRLVLVNLVLAGTLVAGCGAGEGASPTEPATAPAVDVTGRWRGSWTPGTDVEVLMVLRQEGTAVDGTITVVDTSVSLTGGIERLQSAVPVLIWRAADAGCGRFDGRLEISGNEMTGSATLDTQRCEESGRFHGDMRLRRAGSAIRAPEPGAGTVEDLARRLRPPFAGRPPG